MSVRIAAVGDVHFAPDARGTLRPHWERLPECADALLLAGDLTRHGDPEEARALADEVAGLEVPMVAVLGNHDYHCDRQDEVTRIMRGVGVTVLEGDSCVLENGGSSIGIVGAKGFGGGFAGAAWGDFGEPETKAFIRLGERLASALAGELKRAQGDHRIALLHYSPVRDTLQGEVAELYPFLGSYRLAEAIDEVGVQLTIHGHAHYGTEKGTTPGGVPVRNVAQPVIKKAFSLFDLDSDASPR